MTDKAISPQRQADAMMDKINQTGLTKTIALSIGVHIVLIAVTSIPFILLCVKYGTVDMVAIEEQEIALRKKEEEANKQKDVPAASDKDPAKSDTGTEKKPADSDKPKETRKSDAIKKLEEVDLKPPKGTNVSMDAVDIPN